MERKTERDERNSRLLHLALRGDAEATELLMEANSPLVYKLARSFMGRGCEFEDLVQIGSIGMLKAIRSFDESRGFAFSTYAVPLIVGEIRRFLRDDGIMKVSRRMKQNAAMVLRAREEFAAETGRDAHIDELCEKCGLTAEEITEALSSATPVRSLAEPVGGDEDLLLESTIAGEDEIGKRTEALALAQAMQTLDPIQQKIICLRYFRDLSQKETAERMGLTQVKISREEKKIFAALRRELTGVG